jgi:hypothetical protein
MITRTRLLAGVAGLAVAAGLLMAPAAGAVVTTGAGASAATGAAAFKYKMFKTPSGNIQCVMLKSGGRWSMRCDVYEHDWTAPPRSRPCEAGDYGSSVSMGGKARPRFICVSDAIGATRVLKYGKKLDYGPFLCKSKRKGLKCWNKRDRGWFLSKQRYRFF